MGFFRRIFFNDCDDRDPRASGRLSIVPPPRTPMLWTVGGGKGGVGKSLVSSNMGAFQAMAGNKVLLVDADLGAANLHTFLGLEGSSLSLSSFLKSEIQDVRQLIIKTDIRGLDLISGAKDSLDVADLSGPAIIRLNSALVKLDYDYIVMDIGPGTSSNMLDLFLMSDEGVIVTTPEPTSIENGYRFLKCLFLRRIRNIINSQKDSGLKDLMYKVFNGQWSQRIKTVSDILQNIRELDPARGEILRDFMGKTSVSLIVNQVKKPQDRDIGPSMEKVCRDYFGITIRHLGDIVFDDCVSDSVRLKRPLAVNYPQSGSALSIGECVGKLKAAGHDRSAVKKACV